MRAPSATTPPPGATPGAPNLPPATARKGPHTIPRGKPRPPPEPPSILPSGMVELPPVGPAGRSGPSGVMVGAGDSMSDLSIAEISDAEELVGSGDSNDPLILPPKRR